MNAPALRLTRLGPLLAMLAALNSPPSAGSDPVGLRAVAGLPQAGTSAGGTTGWRNYGVVAESDLVDAEVKVATCASPSSPVPATIGGTVGACSAPSGIGTDGGFGRQLRATFKIPRWHADAPLVDVTLRSWRSQVRLSEGRERTSGSAAEVAVTHVLGLVEAFYGYSAPLAPSNAQGTWRSAFAGLSWRPAPGTTLEFVVDRGTEAATGTVDRTLTLRVARSAERGGPRFVVSVTRSLDDRAEAVRAGLGLDFVF